MTPNPLSDQLASATNAFVAGLRGFGHRILIHIGGLVAASFGSSMASGNALLEPVSTTLGLCVYVGTICLFPRGIGKNPKWLLPTGTGLFQLLLLAFAGIPWQAALFWGGVQTWLQRMWWTKGKMGWEWTVTPILLGGIASFFDIAPGAGINAMPIWSVLPVALIGAALQAFYFRKKTIPYYAALLGSARRRLLNAAGGDRLPETLQGPLRILAEHTEQYIRLTPAWKQSDLVLVEAINDTSLQVERLSSRAAPKTWDEQAGRVLGRVNSLGDSLRTQMQIIPALPRQELSGTDTEQLPALSPGSSMEERADMFRDYALKLAAKQQDLPRELRPHLEGIRKATDNILDCMLKDPEDRAPGEKFLSRYLPAAHKVVNEHIRLSRDGSSHQNVQEALAHSGELLARLEQAFISEHGSLLQNDTMNFTAELNLVDKLLKMQGR